MLDETPLEASPDSELDADDPDSDVPPDIADLLESEDSSWESIVASYAAMFIVLLITFAIAVYAAIQLF